MPTRRALLTGLLAGTASAACTPEGTPVTSLRTTLRYGRHPRQVVDLWRPEAAMSRAVVVMLHGGFWRARYDRSLQDEVIADLLAAGYTVANVEYRPVGDGGGWPQTFEDVAAALDALADAEDAVDLDRVVTVGHSAGGALAMWAAARHTLPDGAPGAAPRVRPAAACSQAGVLDLVAGVHMGLGGRAVLDLMGVPHTEDPQRYALGSPVLRLPYGVPLLAVTGRDDDEVPPALSEGFAQVARAAGDDVTLDIVDGEGHYEHLDPASRCWASVRKWLADVLP